MITLATLKDATAQEVFDQVKNHMLTQNAKSLDKKGYCKYRGESGRKCAAGCLIADDEYDPSFDNGGIDESGITWGALVSRRKAPHEHESLIDELQTIHDDSPVEEWEQKLNDLAIQRGLNP